MASATSGGRDRHRMALIGAGWIGGIHLDALDRLGRTQLVGVASASVESARVLAGARGAAAYADLDQMLDETRPDVAWVAVPPAHAAPICLALIERGIPFLVEKPLGSVDATGPDAVAAAIAARRLVVAVGYHLRAVDGVDEVRQRLAANPPHLVVGRWIGGTPPPTWWQRAALGGGQVIEQATHLYDMARLVAGEATVVGAASTRSDPPQPEGADVVDATTAILRFDSGAIGSFTNTRRIDSSVTDVSFAADGLLATIGRPGGAPGGWTVVFADADGERARPPGRDPYERQAEVFLDAVEANDPAAVLSSYDDALRTYRLTHAVVAATGRPG